MTGRYTAVEGIEGAGKSSIAALLAGRLEEAGEPVVAVREPGGTPVGERIREILLDPGGDLEPWTEAMLFAAARAELVRQVVGPALDSGAWVVSDRSAYSSLAYQGAGRRLGVDAVRAVNDVAIGGRWPDQVVLLRVDPQRGLGRQEIADRIGGEGVPFQAEVARAFDSLASAEPGRFVVVDASRPLQEVVEETWAELQTRMRRSKT